MKMGGVKPGVTTCVTKTTGEKKAESLVEQTKGQQVLAQIYLRTSDLIF